MHVRVGADEIRGRCTEALGFGLQWVALPLAAIGGTCQSFTLPDAPRVAGVIGLGVEQASGFLKSSLGGSNVQPRSRDAGLDGGQDSARQLKGWGGVGGYTKWMICMEENEKEMLWGCRYLNQTNRTKQNKAK